MKKDIVDKIFAETLKIFLRWLEKKPTGEFLFHINVNEGGVRDRPDITIKEKI